MHILLPASSDIYLTGGKSHHSEIRLARFIIKHLNPGNQFFDIGAHYGYFTLLAEKITGSTGKVVAFEASPTTFRILKQNTADLPNIEIFNNAVSDENTTLTFYEFPNQYSEYNAMDVRQFEKEGWYKSNTPEKVSIHSITLDDITNTYGWSPAMVKIDVEGAEYKVLNGFKSYLSIHNPFVIMEFLNEERGNEEHVKAEKLLFSMGYAAHLINSDGALSSIGNASAYLQQQRIESDNIVYLKSY